MNYTLEPIINKKMWMLKVDGKKYGTLERVEHKKYVIRYNNGDVSYSTEEELKNKFEISFDKKPEKHIENEIHGYPTASKPYNEYYDIKQKIPMYSINKKSQSMVCAGYYGVKKADEWVISFCPKFAILNKSEFVGPFKTQKDLLNILNNSKI